MPAAAALDQVPVLPVRALRVGPAERLGIIVPAVVQTANVGRQYAGGNGSWCPEVEVLDHAPVEPERRQRADLFWFSHRFKQRSEGDAGHFHGSLDLNSDPR